METSPRYPKPSWRRKPRLEGRPATILSSLIHRTSLLVRPKRPVAVTNNLAPQGWHLERSRNCRRCLHHVTSRVNTRNRHRLGNRTSKHLGKIKTLAEIRGRHWITKGLATVRKHIRKCITCHMTTAKVTPPRMAPFPAHRLQSHIRPFTNVGIDYFGPFNTVVGRRQEKRYGALFTWCSEDTAPFNQSRPSRVSTLPHQRLLYLSLPTFRQPPRSSPCRLQR